MNGRAYYNERDPFAAQWLRNLIAAGHIAAGDVGERDIRDIRPADLAGYIQCHFFAGIGVWSYALRQAGWPDARPVWTGSCPCQPFSAAGGRSGFADERHLWPHWFHLIRVCRPANVFGEQVSSKDGLAWLDLIQADLEGEGYACGPLDSCAAGVGAPHGRHRLYFVADSSSKRAGFGRAAEQVRHRTKIGIPGPDSEARLLGNADSARRGGVSQRDERKEDGQPTSFRADAQRSGFWSDADWLLCRDDKWRPVEPGTFPLAHGAPSRVGRLRGYGNALVAPHAQEFIASFLDVEITP